MSLRRRSSHRNIQEPVADRIDYSGLADNRLSDPIIAVTRMDMAVDEKSWLKPIDEPAEARESTMGSRPIVDSFGGSMCDHEV